MSQKFPEVIYVKQEEDGDNSFLVADDDSAGLAEMGEDVPVAVYRLETTGVLVTRSEIQSVEAKGAASKPAKKRAANKPAETVVEAQSTAPTVTEAVKHTVEHVQTALESVFSKHGLAMARDLLARFGVQRAKDLKPEQYTAFVTDAGKVVETGKV